MPHRAPSRSFDPPQPLLKRAVELIQVGLDETDVYHRLIAGGVAPRLAWAVAVRGWETYYDRRRQTAVSKMMFGALWIVAGLLITFLCYSAKALGGATYLVAYAPIAVGIVVIFRGILDIPPMNSSRGRRGERVAGYSAR